MSGKDKDFQLLFQFDSEDEAGLHWTDCGLVYVFIIQKPKKLFLKFNIRVVR